MTVPNLVLDLFPGIGLLARAFEAEGYCVVSGPDLIFGGDVRTFHPPAGVFAGVIGGPPCQAFSRLRHMRPEHETPAPNLIPEFERCVDVAAPDWWLMENVPDAPLPAVAGYHVAALLYNNRWAPESPEQNRVRRFSFGTPDGRPLIPNEGAIENPVWRPAVVANGAYPAMHSRQDYKRLGTMRTFPDRRSAKGLAESIRLQGLPEDFLAKAPFTVEGKQMVVGNGVPLPMGRAVAAAVRRAMADHLIESAS